jgi:hypothetical protein
MSEENQIEESNEDSFVDAVCAIALVAIAVCAALYWVSNQ